VLPAVRSGIAVMNRGELVLAGDLLVDTASPTVPIPKTATVEPGSTAATFQAAPTPASKHRHQHDFSRLKGAFVF
jgi:hypothetical protein